MSYQSSTYYQQENRKFNLKTKEIISPLPSYVQNFFISIHDSSTALTRYQYACDLREFFDFLCEDDKTYKDITLSDIGNLQAFDFERFLAHLSDYKTPTGLDASCGARAKTRKFSTIRRFYRYLFTHNLISVNNTEGCQRPKIQEKAIVRLDNEEVKEMLNTIKNGTGLTNYQKAYHENSKVRDYAIVCLFLGTGIRVSELVGINIDDIDFDENSFLVTRKGGDQSILYFEDYVKDALLAYQDEKEMLMAELSENEKTSDFAKQIEYAEAFFLTSRHPYKRIAVRSVEKLIKKYAQIVTPLKKISPHKLRSTFATSVYEQTRDIYVVSKLLGHKSMNTTTIYADMNEQIKRKATGKTALSKAVKDISREEKKLENSSSTSSPSPCGFKELFDPSDPSDTN